MLEYECAACISLPNVTLEAENDENRISCISLTEFVVSEFELSDFVESFLCELFITPLVT